MLHIHCDGNFELVYFKTYIFWLRGGGKGKDGLVFNWVPPQRNVWFSESKKPCFLCLGTMLRKWTASCPATLMPPGLTSVSILWNPQSVRSQVTMSKIYICTVKRCPNSNTILSPKMFLMNLHYSFSLVTKHPEKVIFLGFSFRILGNVLEHSIVFSCRFVCLYTRHRNFISFNVIGIREGLLRHRGATAP